MSEIFLLAALIIAIIALTRANSAERKADAAHQLLERLGMELRNLRAEMRGARHGGVPTSAKTAPDASTVPTTEGAMPPQERPAPQARVATASPPPPALASPSPRPVAPSRSPTPPSPTIPARTAETTPVATRAPAPTRAPARPSASRTESIAGGRWATRIGLVFALLGAIFFGVYVGQNTTPPMRWAGLCAVSLGLLGLGHWKRHAWGAYARALFSGGLSFVFLTALAGYALPATRITDSPLTGWCMQLGAVIFVAVVGAWKRDERIALLAGGLGAVAGGFSILLDLSLYTLPYTVGWVLTLTALGSLRRWDLTRAVGPAVGIALLGTRLAHNLLMASPPSALGDHLTAAALLAIVLASGSLRERWQRPTWRLSVTSAGAAALVAWHLAEMALFHRELLGGAYLGWSLLFGVLAAIALGRGESRLLTEGWILKGAILFTLFLVEQFEGGTRVVSLALQGFALLALWHRGRSKWLAAAWVALAVTALAFLGRETLLRFPHPVTALQETWWVWLAWIGLLAQSEGTRLLRTWSGSGFHSSVAEAVNPRFSTDAFLAFIGQWGLGVAAILLQNHLFPTEFHSVACFLLMLTVLGAAAVVRSMTLAACGGLLLLASWTYWFIDPGKTLPFAPHGMLLGPLGVLLAAGVIGLKQTRFRQSGILTHLSHLPFALALISLARWAAWVLPMEWQAAFLLVIGLGLLVIPPRTLQHSAPLGIFAGLLAALLALNNLREMYQWSQTDFTSASAAWLLSLVMVIALATRLANPDEPAREFPSLWRSAAQAIYLVIWLAALSVIPNEDWSLAFVLAALLALQGLTHFRPDFRTTPAQVVLGIGLWAGGILFCFQLGDGSLIKWLSVFAAIGWLLHRALRLPSGFRVRIALCATGAVSLAMVLPIGAGGAWHGFATAIWGLAGLLAFVSGLFADRRALRVVGLAALAAAMSRAFIVDLDQTFERIIAFFGLGVILLVIGYLYHGFSQRLEKTPSTEVDESAER